MTPTKKERKGAAAQQDIKSSVATITPEKVPLSPSNFLLLFPLLCAEEEASVIPKVKVKDSVGNISTYMSKKESTASIPRSSSCDQLQPVVTVAFNIPDNLQDPWQISFKGIEIDLGLTKAIGRCLNIFSTITVLKLEDCKLKDSTLAMLASCLGEIKTVQDLSLDMNPIKEQTYFCILHKDTRLQHLSLRQCFLNDYGVYLLSQELQYKDEDGAHQTLLSLNLTNNCITCQGARYLANEADTKTSMQHGSSSTQYACTPSVESTVIKTLRSLIFENLASSIANQIGQVYYILCQPTTLQALRTNRTLSVLSLAGNTVGDDGVVALAEVLENFPLVHEEVVMKRHRNMARLLKRNSLAEQKLQETKPQLPKIGPVRGSSPPIKRKETRSNNVRDKKKAITPLSTPLITEQQQQQQQQQNLKLQAEHEMEQDPHPFMTETTHRGGEVWCKGNTRLAHINLGYNQVGMIGVNALLRAAQWQESSASSPYRGLLYIVLQGNPIPEKCFELRALTELIASRNVRANKSSTVPTREPSLSNINNSSNRQLSKEKSMESRNKLLTAKKETKKPSRKKDR